MRRTVFVSYSRAHEDFAAALVADLRTLGCEVYRDTGIHAGQRWWDVILEWIRTADVFVYLLDPRSLASPHCRAEHRYARDLGKSILPVLASAEVNPFALPDGLSEVQCVTYLERDPETVLELARSIFLLPPSPPLPEPLPAPPAVPERELDRIARRLAVTEPLSADEQKALVFTLRQAATRPEARDEARRLLATMKSREELLAVVSTEIDDILDSASKGNSNQTDHDRPRPSPSRRPGTRNDERRTVTLPAFIVVQLTGIVSALVIVMFTAYYIIGNVRLTAVGMNTAFFYAIFLLPTSYLYMTSQREKIGFTGTLAGQIGAGMVLASYIWLGETGAISRSTMSGWAVAMTALVLPSCGAILQGIIERKVEAH